MIQKSVENEEFENNLKKQQYLFKQNWLPNIANYLLKHTLQHFILSMVLSTFSRSNRKGFLLSSSVTWSQNFFVCFWHMKIKINVGKFHPQNTPKSVSIKIISKFNIRYASFIHNTKNTNWKSLEIKIENYQ